MTNNTEKAQLTIPRVRCSVCGRFMRKLKLLERARLEVESGLKRTHICRKETISYADGLLNTINITHNGRFNRSLHR